MQFTKKTLVVMMCTALQAGVVMASGNDFDKMESTNLNSPDAQNIKSVTIGGENGKEAQHYYALVFHGDKENLTLGDVKVSVKNGSGVTPAGVKDVDNLLVAGGFVGEVVGKDVSSALKTGKLVVDVTNVMPGENQKNMVSADTYFASANGNGVVFSSSSNQVDFHVDNSSDNVNIHGISLSSKEGGNIVYKLSGEEESSIVLNSKSDPNLQNVRADGVLLSVRDNASSTADFSKLKINVNIDNSKVGYDSENDFIKNSPIAGVNQDTSYVHAEQRSPEAIMAEEIFEGMKFQVGPKQGQFADSSIAAYLYTVYTKGPENNYYKFLVDNGVDVKEMGTLYQKNDWDQADEDYLFDARDKMKAMTTDTVPVVDNSTSTMIFDDELKIDVTSGYSIAGVKSTSGNSSKNKMEFNGPVSVTLDSKMGGSVKEPYSVGVKAFSYKNAVTEIAFHDSLTVENKVAGLKTYGLLVEAAENGSTSVVVDGPLSVTSRKGILVNIKSDNPGKLASLVLNGSVHVDASYEGDSGERLLDRALDVNFDGASLIIPGGNKVGILGDVYVSGNSEADVTLNVPKSKIEGDIEVFTKGTLNLTLDGDEVEYIGNFRSRQGDEYRGHFNLILRNGSHAILPVVVSPGTQTERFELNTVESLDMSSGAKLEFTKADNRTLVADNLTGNGGVFVLPLDAGKNESNVPTINVTDRFEGEHIIDFKIFNDKDPSKAEGTVVARVNSGDGRFLVKEEDEGLFWRHVNLEKVKVDDVDESKRADLAPFKTAYEDYWVIKSIDDIAPADKPTPLVDSIVSSRLAGHALWSGRLADDTLMERLGDIRLSGEESNGLWIRTKHSRAKLDDVYSLKMNTHHYELGYDYSSASDNGRVFWGGSFNWDDGKADLRKGDSKVRSVGIGLYRSQTFDNGWYVDTIARIDRQRNKLRSTDADGKAYDGSVNQWGFSLSGEVGRTFDIAKGMFVQPEAQLTFGHLNGKSFTTSNDVSVDSDAVKALISRIGVKAGMTFDSNKGNVYAKADLLREWLGKDVVSLATKDGSLEVTEKNRKTWGRVGLGANYHFNKAFSAHGSFDYDIKSRWGDHASVNVGVRYSF